MEPNADATSYPQIYHCVAVWQAPPMAWMRSRAYCRLVAATLLLKARSACRALDDGERPLLRR